MLPTPPLSPPSSQCPTRSRCGPQSLSHVARSCRNEPDRYSPVNVKPPSSRKGKPAVRRVFSGFKGPGEPTPNTTCHFCKKRKIVCRLYSAGDLTCMLVFPPLFLSKILLIRSSLASANRVDCLASTPPGLIVGNAMRTVTSPAVNVKRRIPSFAVNASGFAHKPNIHSAPNPNHYNRHLYYSPSLVRHRLFSFSLMCVILVLLSSLPIVPMISRSFSNSPNVFFLFLSPPSFGGYTPSLSGAGA